MNEDDAFKKEWSKLENSMGVKVFDEREYSENCSLIRYGYLQKSGDTIILRSFSEEKRKIPIEEAKQMLLKFVSGKC